ncbi:hypothetical protein KFL_001600210 [Klebsormidium nitens]|uniref:RNA methyltransferase n=1 Tax=Klebsormidium nitens TaxID=105231 RepID=A0A1Y1I3J7_KLENI|nr:hypothetical protein KFL_001600210 [Klebsormidium nitens]|eukprot:GAQ83751.1 hypothetical protein KFL_001600210 [Klebsormidium nitens]
MASEDERNGGAVGPEPPQKSSHGKASDSALRKKKGSSHHAELESGKFEENSRKKSSAGKVKKRKHEANGKDTTEAVGDHEKKHKTPVEDSQKVRKSPDTSRGPRHHVSEGEASGGKVAKDKKKKEAKNLKQKAVKNAAEVATKPDTQSTGHQGRDWTVSIAVAGSIVDNAQSLELATALAGQIARAAAIFCVDEVVVFEDGDDDPGRRAPRWRRGEAGDSGAVFLARLLQYCETPQYLRRHLIPMHPDLRTAGLLAPLDAPHHARAHEWIPYREGVVVVKPSAGGKASGGSGALVNVGLQKEVRIAQSLEAGLRVTMAMGDSREALDAGRPLSAVSPSEPRERLGLYWGYTVRLAKGLSGVLAECPYAAGYDYTLGTSEHGEKLQSTELTLPAFKHLLIVFGGLAGLEESTELDGDIEVKDTAALFDRYLNTCSGQGSRTIRTEEALLISLTFLHEPIQRAVGK